MTSTPTNTPATNCAFTQGFWKNHPSAWPLPSLSIGGKVYSKAQMILILQTPPNGDATYILAQQLIAAKLNIAYGADGSAVASTIAVADAWLSSHPLGSNPQGAARNVGTGYASLLDAFNNGTIGPGHCIEYIAPLPSPLAIAVPWMSGPKKMSFRLHLGEDILGTFDFYILANAGSKTYAIDLGGNVKAGISAAARNVEAGKVRAGETVAVSAALPSAMSGQKITLYAVAVVAGRIPPVSGLDDLTEDTPYVIMMDTKTVGPGL